MIRVAVAATARAGVAQEIELDLADGATAIDAAFASGFIASDEPAASVSARLGIWGRACAGNVPLRTGDRVEIYRPLAMSADEARRLRARKRRLRR